MRRFLTLPSIRRHRGSVLILVVVMVVLLALLGTALLSTSRGDRFTSTQHVANTQIDLLVDGVKELARSKIAGSLQGAEGFRPAMDSKATIGPTSYADYDGAKLTAAAVDDLGRDWLAMRTPTNVAAGGTQTVYWPTIGIPLTGGTVFESPIVLDDATDTISTTISPRFENRISTALPDPEFEPRSFTFDGVTYPAFRMQGTLNGATNPLYGRYLAADADGDGIADSGFFRLPVGQLDGVTYFAAVRIVDNSSAINLNTAGSRAYDRLPNPSPVAAPAGDPCAANPAAGDPALADFAENLGWFHSHVGLQELLNRQNRPAADADQHAYATFAAHNYPPATGEPNAQAEMFALDRFRLGYDTSDNALTRANATAGRDIRIDTSNQPTMPYTPVPARTYNNAVAAYLTMGDVLENTLAKRLRNPGLNVLNTGAFGLARSFSLSDAAALAYHNGVMLNTDAGLSTVDSTFYNARNTTAYGITNIPLADSIYSSVANYTQNATHLAIPSGAMKGRKAYAPGDAYKWFDDNYFADAGAPGSPVQTFNNTAAQTLTLGGKYRTLRPYVTTWNPVGKLTPRRTFDDQYVSVSAVGVDLPAYAPPAPAAAWPVIIPVNNINTVRPTVSKTSINTAQFQELWTSFQHVMAEANQGGGNYISNSPFDTAAPTAPLNRATLYEGSGFTQVVTGIGAVDSADPASVNNERMFRSSLRDGASTGIAPLCFSSKSMVALRSAIAATQTEQLRMNSTAAPTQVIHQFKLQATSGGINPILNVTVFGQVPQPFITEVFVSCDYTTTDPAGLGTTNPRGYVCVELYNPFPTPIDLTNYDMVVVDRYEGAAGSTYRPLAAGGAGILATQQVNVPFAGVIIPPYQYVVIDNIGAGVNAATYRPAAAGPAVAGTLAAPLQMAIGDYRVNPTPPLDQSKELVLRRAYTAPAPLPGGMTPAQTMAAYQPVDSFDFYNIGLQPQAVTFDYHYNRPKGQPNNWQCVYPGRYFAPEVATAGIFEHRQQGTDRSPSYNTGIIPPAPSPWTGGIGGGHTEVLFGQPQIRPSYALGAGAPPTIQMINNGQPGPNPIPGAPTRFPYGCFGREADMLQVPFIGSYVVQDATSGDLIEMNSVSMDAAFAEDTDLIDDPQAGALPGSTSPEPHEQIGHFCPIYDTAAPSINRDDLSSATVGGTYNQATPTNMWNYRWATKLFTYFTVHSSQSDYLPDFDPSMLGTVIPPPPVNTPTKIDNDGDTYGNGSINTTTLGNREDLDPAQGLINVNTAPWRVMAALPFFKTGNNHTYRVATQDWIAGPSADGVDDNTKLARLIATWRDGTPGVAANGPLKSTFDLYRCPAFKTAQELQLTEAATANGALNSGPNATQGDFSVGDPAGALGDFARNDSEEQYFLLNRISNLVTTRSDSFTVYVLVQGWRGIGDPTFRSPQLVVQRRAAFIQDRYNVFQQSEPLNTSINIPND